MKPSTEHGEASGDRAGPDRRAMALGLASLCLPPASAKPQDATVAPAASLLSNLVTRMATWIVLNGRDGYRFVIDTGAARSVLARDVAETLGLPAGPTVLVHGITSAERTPTARLAELGLGSHRFENLVLPVFPRAALVADGLLGLDVLSRFELQFDLAGRLVELTPSLGKGIRLDASHNAASRLTPRRSSRSRAGRFGQIILIDSRVGGVPVEAFVDSGAQHSIGNLALLAALGRRARSQDAAATSSRFIVHGVTGQVLSAEASTVGEVQIGRQNLGPTPLLFADPHAFGLMDMIGRPALLIGADILYRFSRVTLDFGRSSLVFGGLRRRVAARA